MLGVVHQASLCVPAVPVQHNISSLKREPTHATMYELYYAPTTASLSVHWVLIHLEQELGIAHSTHTVDFSKSEQKSDSYLAINPKGRVPTLLTSDNGALSESSAILLHLAERHPNAHLAPAEGARGKYFETMMFLANSLLPALRDKIYAGKDGAGGSAAEAVIDLSETKLRQTWDLLNDQLEGQEYLLGDEVSVADFLMVSVTGWMDWIEEEACERANVRRVVRKMKERKDWLEVLKREEEAKAAM